MALVSLPRMGASKEREISDPEDGCGKELDGMEETMENDESGVSARIENRSERCYNLILGFPQRLATSGGTRRREWLVK